MGVRCRASLVASGAMKTTAMEEMGDMSQSKRPVAKVAAAGTGGAAATVLIAIASQLGLDLPPEVAAAITTVLAFAAGYLKRDES